jgi:hypothetical protein
MDQRHKNNANNGQSNETPSIPAEAPFQKLALNDKLCNAFCTLAGLFAEAIDQIWQGTQGNK